MNLKKVTATIMSIVLLMTLLAACANEPEQPQIMGQAEEQHEETQERGQAQEPEEFGLAEEETGQENVLTQEPSHSDISDIDFETAFAAFPPDTVMFTVGDLDVTWEILYFRIHVAVASLFTNLGRLPYLSTPTPGGVTYAEMIMEFAVQASRQLKVGEFVARELGVQLEEDDLELLELTLQENINAAGGEDALLEHLWGAYGIDSIELFREILMLEYIPMVIFVSQFGEMGSALPDEEVAAHFEDGGFIMAKHILRQRSADAPEEALREIEEIYMMLREYRGDDFESFFDELMHEHTGDPGVTMFPDGYLFQAGDMVQPFYEAAAALEIGDMSGIVETTHGYHIILRLPLNYDTTFVSDSLTLRARAAFDKYEAMMTQAMNELTPIFTAEFESLNLADLFEPCILF